MESLVISILALFAAAPLYELLKDNLGLQRLLDGFIFVAIGGLVLTLLLPEALGIAGWVALPVFFAGFLLPSLSENLFVKSTRPLHFSALALGILAFALHVLADGAALAGGHDHSHEHHGLELGVILHRLPIGLAIWWYIRPLFGITAGLLVLALVTLGTVIGYLWAPSAMALLNNEGIGLFQAFVAGTLMHIIFHSQHHAHEIGTHVHPRKWWEGAGNLLGAAFVVYFFSSHTHEEVDATTSWFGQFSSSFVTLLLESAPALVLALIAAALLATFLPKSYLSWMSKGSRIQQAARGTAVGLPIPVCSYGVVPLYDTLIKRGVPPSAAAAFLVATPELGVDAILLSLPLLGETMTLVRIVAAIVIAVLAGLIMGHLIKTSAPAQPAETSTETHQNHVITRFRLAFLEMVDHTFPWIMAGLFLAAAVAPFLQNGGLSWLPDHLEIPFFAMLGVPMYVCASGATPFVAVLLLAGISPGAAVAFLLTGPVTNVTTIGVLARYHGRVIAVAFGGVTFTTAIGLGYLTNMVLADFSPLTIALNDPDKGPVQIGMMVILVVLLIDSLLRCGARAFLGELYPSRHNHSHHEHAHTHHH